jgi:hypothetical protein
MGTFAETTIVDYHLSYAANNKKIPISVFRLPFEANKRKWPFSVSSGSSVFRVFVCYCICLYLYLYLYLYAPVSNGKGKRKPRQFSLIRLPFAHRAIGSYPISKRAKRTKRTKRTCSSMMIFHDTYPPQQWCIFTLQEPLANNIFHALASYDF